MQGKVIGAEGAPIRQLQFSFFKQDCFSGLLAYTVERKMRQAAKGLLTRFLNSQEKISGRYYKQSSFI